MGPHYREDYLPAEPHDLDETIPNFEEFSPIKTRNVVQREIKEEVIELKSSSDGVDKENI